ncbi:MAG: RDD family protein [Bdellovibrionota bacterium]
MPCQNHPELIEGLSPCTACGRDYCPQCLAKTPDGRWLCPDCQYSRLSANLVAAGGQEKTGSTFGRFVALIVDQLIVGLPLWIVAKILLYAAKATDDSLLVSIALLFGAWTFLVVIFAVKVCYEGFFLSRNGATPGKDWLGLRVVSAVGGVPLSPSQAWLRALVRALLDNVPGVNLINYLVAFFNPERRCIHDFAAGTRVMGD